MSVSVECRKTIHVCCSTRNTSSTSSQGQQLAWVRSHVTREVESSFRRPNQVRVVAICCIFTLAQVYLQLDTESAEAPTALEQAFEDVVNCGLGISSFRGHQHSDMGSQSALKTHACKCKPARSKLAAFSRSSAVDLACHSFAVACPMNSKPCAARSPRAPRARARPARRSARTHGS